MCLYMCMGTRCATRRWCAFIPSAAAELRLCHPPNDKPRLPRYARVYYICTISYYRSSLGIFVSVIYVCARGGEICVRSPQQSNRWFGVFGRRCLVPALVVRKSRLWCVVALSSLFAIATIAITEAYAELGPELTLVKYLCVLCLPCMLCWEWAVLRVVDVLNNRKKSVKSPR